MEVIGYLETVDIPMLQLYKLDAKIDTGADSCALHCNEITVVGSEVTFTLYDKVHQAYHGKSITLPIYKITQVKSSNGKSQNRVVIKVPIKLGCKSHQAEITLANRENMKYPMLIGRRFLAHNYLVDTSKKHMTKEAK